MGEKEGNQRGREGEREREKERLSKCIHWSTSLGAKINVLTRLGTEYSSNWGKDTDETAVLSVPSRNQETAISSSIRGSAEIHAPDIDHSFVPPSLPLRVTEQNANASEVHQSQVVPNVVSCRCDKPGLAVMVLLLLISCRWDSMTLLWILNSA